MTVVRLQQTERHPGNPADYEDHWHDQLPTHLRALLGGRPHPGDEQAGWLVAEYLPDLCRLGVPESVLERAVGWGAGWLAAWRQLPHDHTWAICARELGDRCAQASAAAEAELAATLQRRGATDARTAQWLLERRSPGRWSPASDDAMAQARREGADEERARMARSGWTPPPSDGGLRLPLKE
jgi:hypothetical protein